VSSMFRVRDVRTTMADASVTAARTSKKGASSSLSGVSRFRAPDMVLSGADGGALRTRDFHDRDRSRVDPRVYVADLLPAQFLITPATLAAGCHPFDQVMLREENPFRDLIKIRILGPILALHCMEKSYRFKQKVAHHHCDHPLTVTATAIRVFKPEFKFRSLDRPP